jgi:dTDP-4-amino-4,6-dideoxygalactose transaminase
MFNSSTSCLRYWIRELPNVSSVYHLYVICISDRDRFRENLASFEIETGIHYPVPLHLQEAYKKLGYRHGDFPAAERLASTIVSLPMFPPTTGRAAATRRRRRSGFGELEVQALQLPTGTWS